MTSRKLIVMPSVRKVLKQMGENIKLARLRRKLSVIQVCERADIARVTLWQIEKGSPSVSMGLYCQVLFILGLEKDIAEIAKDDILGRKLQDAELIPKERAPKKSSHNE